MTNIFATLSVLHFVSRNNICVPKIVMKKSCNINYVAKDFCNINFVAKYFCNTTLVAIIRTALDVR